MTSPTFAEARALASVARQALTFCRRPERAARAARAVLWFAAFVVFFSPAGAARAHELVVDRVELRPWARAGELSGQLVLDPELSRGLDEAASDESERRLFTFLTHQLRVLSDGEPLALSFSLREAWTRGGAVPGDLVNVRAPLPAPPRAVEVVLGDAFAWVVLTLDEAPEGAPAEPYSVLLRGGDRSPPFTLRGAGPGVTPDPAAGAGPARPLRGVWIGGGGAPLEQQVALERQSDLQRQGAGPEPRTGAADAPRRGSGLGRELWRFFWLGVTHIVPLGWDHLAFISGLVLASLQRQRAGRWRRLVWLLSAFTLAHTLTLAFGALGWVAPSPDLVEPLIGLSVLVIALENLWGSQQSRWRPAVVFAFGLIHGLAFSNLLGSFGIDSERLLPSLFAFNLGVEAGQLLVVAAWLALLPLLEAQQHARLARAGSYVIGGFGAYWFLSRLL